MTRAPFGTSPGRAAPEIADVTADMLARQPVLRRALLELNNAHARELSWLDDAAFKALVANSHAAMVVVPDSALLVAFDDRASYDSPNFAWFQARYDRFIYVDRLVVAPLARGAGIGAMLYGRLFAGARERGYPRICCEVNLIPPNPGSMAFHLRQGFGKVGTAEANGKTVAYLAKEI